ncbi:hypothetical protein GCM10011309_18670 [Litorimonas cladophorae]|uniref:Uncharacterized protein n=1 Tax=Litorimonas cladophorae TaxID=1220491 RepID=A0A918KMA2_9PROT|nr:hypothetical protein [Litorimonas cladophorae]GGX69040.1 hypothetical protein GCM10011309_18670 [Litorimonas cladophorae]
MHKFILTAAVLTAATLVPTVTHSASEAAPLPTATIAVQIENPTASDEGYNIALERAAEETRAVNGDWFTVTYRSDVTEPVVRNVNTSAETRYIRSEADLMEIGVPFTQRLVQTLTLEFNIGTGPMPDRDHTYTALEMPFAIG